MRYEVITDKDNYVKIIKHNIDERKNIYEIDLSKYDLMGLRLYAHKIVDKTLVFDENKYQELLNEKTHIDNQKIILDLKTKLNDSDYLVARCFEEVMALTNPLTWIADVIKITTKFAKKYKEVIANRKQWREKIEELED